MNDSYYDSSLLAYVFIVIDLGIFVVLTWNQLKRWGHWGKII